MPRHFPRNRTMEVALSVVRLARRFESPPATPMRSRTTMKVFRTTISLSLLARSLFSLGCQKESESIVSIALHPTNANILYVATNDAVYKSRDGGGTWERFPSFSARRVTTLAIDPLLPATIYAGTRRRSGGTAD